MCGAALFVALWRCVLIGVEHEDAGAFACCQAIVYYVVVPCSRPAGVIAWLTSKI
jgi:hypothetical protein